MQRHVLKIPIEIAILFLYIFLSIVKENLKETVQVSVLLDRYTEYIGGTKWRRSLEGFINHYVRSRGLGGVYSVQV